MKRCIVVVSLAWLSSACIVQTETISGDAGPPGADGGPGDPGVACWDLNGDGTKDPSEDVNGDGSWDAQDCAGSQGLQGVSPFMTKPDGSIYYNGGNVGIGTAAPTKELEVRGSSDNGIRITDSTGNTRLLLQPGGGQNGEVVLYDNTNENTVYLRSSGPSFITSGNVGIGTANPTALLDVGHPGANVTIARFLDSVNNSGFRFTINDTLDSLGYGAPNRHGIKVSSGESLAFLTHNTDVPKLVIDTSGNVGIGTTLPDSKIDVRGQILASWPYGVGYRAFFATSYNPDGVTRVGATSGALDGGQVESRGPFAITTNDVDRIYVSENGNVGIGTSAPATTLHVKSDIPALRLQFSQASGYAQIEANAADDLVFTSAGPNPKSMVLNGAGLGIAMANPAHQLQLSQDDAAKPNGGSWTASSDCRLKKNIVTLPDSLKRLLRLRGVSFEWKEPERQGNQTGTQMGMIAQEVEEVFPEWVRTDRDGFKTLTFHGFEALSVESFRELKADNDHLKAANTELTTRLSNMEDRISSLEKRGAPQHASILGDSTWFSGVLFGSSLTLLLPWWLRRRRDASGSGQG